jgi:hypothetical protein
LTRWGDFAKDGEDGICQNNMEDGAMGLFSI